MTTLVFLSSSQTHHSEAIPEFCNT